MPRRELKYPVQVERWLVGLGEKLTTPGKLILIGSGALLWHAAQRGIETPLPENSMDVDPVTKDDALAELCYDCHTVQVPAPEDLLVPKVRRGEARDLAHQQWALYNGLVNK